MSAADRPMELATAERAKVLPAWLGSAIVLLFALAFGGGTRQGLWSDAVVQLASLPLLATSLWQLAQSKLRASARLALVILALVPLLPLIQLIPLPPAMWTALPGRAAIANSYVEAQMQVPWLGLSLSPPATWRSLLALIPPISIFLAVLLLGRRPRRALALTFIAFAFVSVVLGLAQLAQGPESNLRFYDFTNVSEAVGFFANRNHLAALLYSAMPFTGALAISLAADRRPNMAVGLVLCLLVFASLMLGLGMAHSRGGLILSVFAGLGCLALAWTGSEAGAGRRASHLLSAGVLVGIVLVVQFASVGIMQRLDSDIAGDMRWEFASITLRAARDFLPFGSGLGTFEAIYRMYEGMGQLYTTFVNHAHDDYLEMLLEGGLPAVALFLAFFLWYLSTTFRLWRRPKSGTLSVLDHCLPRAASIVVLMLLLHSVVDYPLRTTAMSSVFAVACAFMINPARSSESGPRAGGGAKRASA